MENEKTRIVVNGEEAEVPSGATISDLLGQLGLKPGQVAVELNREIVRRERWQTLSLNTGDQIEVVHFVGGG